MAEATPKPNAKGVILERTLETYLVKKAPFQIPANGREVIVKLAPWIDLVLLILLLPAILVVFTLGSAVGVLAPTVGVAVGPLYYAALFVLIAQAVVMGIAIPGLFKRKQSAWKLLYYATLVSLAYGVVDWLATPAAIMGLLWSLISVTISLYILFQVRGLYRA